MDKKYLYALSVLAGTIIGVGLFSLPFITAKVGIGVILGYFLILGLLMVLVQLMLGEIALSTKKLHRLPGYAKIYLGKWGFRIELLVVIFGLWGALLLYMVVGGQFLASLLSPAFDTLSTSIIPLSGVGNTLFWTLVYFGLGAILIWTGTKTIGQIEFVLLIVFFLVLLIIFGKGASFIEISNLFQFEARELFLPYGAVLFSLWGMAMIPEVKEMVVSGGKPKALKSIIPLAIFLASATYLSFIVVVLGITGQRTSPEALLGLRDFFGDGIMGLGLSFGVLTTFTSFIALGLTLKKVFWYDLGFSESSSWALTCFLPLACFFLGVQDIIAIISVVGGVFLGIEGIIIILMHFRTKTKREQIPAYSIAVPRGISYFLIFIFVLGIIYEIVYFI